MKSGKYGENLGELVVSLKNGRIKVDSYRVIPVDDKILGDATVQNEVDHLLEASSAAIFEPRGYSLTQPLEVIDRDWPMDFALHTAHFCLYHRSTILCIVIALGLAQSFCYLPSVQSIREYLRSPYHSATIAKFAILARNIKFALLLLHHSILRLYSWR